MAQDNTIRTAYEHVSCKAAKQESDSECVDVPSEWQGFFGYLVSSSFGVRMEVQIRVASFEE